MKFVLRISESIVYKNTWLGNLNILIITVIDYIILDYLKITVPNVFTITTNIQKHRSSIVKEVIWNF